MVPLLGTYPDLGVPTADGESAGARSEDKRRSSVSSQTEVGRRAPWLVPTGLLLCPNCQSLDHTISPGVSADHGTPTLLARVDAKSPHVFLHPKETPRSLGRGQADLRRGGVQNEETSASHAWPQEMSRQICPSGPFLSPAPLGCCRPSIPRAMPRWEGFLCPCGLASESLI